MKQLCRMIALLGLAAFLLVAGGQGARAAQVVISDPLTSWPLNFGAQGPAIMIKDGGLHIVETKGFSNYVTYSGFTFKDMDASVTITSKENVAGDAGLVFWSNALGDYYFFGVSDAAGTFGLYHRLAANGGSWQTIVPWSKDPDVKTGAGAVNMLRVVTKGNMIQLYLNGAPLGHAQVQAPSAGGAIGLIGEGGAKGPSDFVFSNLTVSQ
jgi:hypothetical protein